MWLTRASIWAQHWYWAPQSCWPAICQRGAPCAWIPWWLSDTNRVRSGQGNRFYEDNVVNQWRVYGNAAARRLSRLSRAKKIAGLYRHRCAHACARHRREYCALLCGERSAAAPFAVQESFETSVGLGKVSPLRARRRFSVRFSGLSRAEPILRILRRESSGRFAFQSHWNRQAHSDHGLHDNGRILRRSWRSTPLWPLV